MRQYQVYTVRFTLLIFVCIAVAACAGVNESLRHRIKGEQPVVRFGCADFAPAEIAQIQESIGSVVLVNGPVEPGLDDTLAGTLLHGLDSHGIRVVFVEPLPMDVLLVDSGNLLSSLGYSVEKYPNDELPRIQLGIQGLKTGQIFGRWNEVKGTTWAQIYLKVVILDGEEAVRTWDLVQREEIRVTYFLASQFESTLDTSYCRLLDDLAVLFRSREFETTVQALGQRAISNAILSSDRQ